MFPVVSLAMMVLSGPASADLATDGNPAFCTPEKPVRDFGFSKLPSVREAPESAKSLGYGAVDVYGGWSRVMAEPGPFGYGFSEHSYSGSGVLLDWTVTAQLWAVDRHGAALREVDREELFIGRLSAAHQPHIEVDPLEKRRGFYRFDMQIARKGGEVIGAYSAYFKVVRPSWSPRLRLSRDSVRAGQRLQIRVENYGSEMVTYGESFGVQRLEAGRWVPAPDLTPDGWLMWLGFLGPGGTGRCSSLSLPADTPAGSYRIVKEVGTARWPMEKKARLAAPFRVVSPGTAIDSRDEG